MILLPVFVWTCLDDRGQISDRSIIHELSAFHGLFSRLNRIRNEVLRHNEQGQKSPPLWLRQVRRKFEDRQVWVFVADFGNQFLNLGTDAKPAAVLDDPCGSGVIIVTVDGWSGMRLLADMATSNIVG